MVKINRSDFFEEERVSSKICENDDEAIKSEAFLKGFEACIRRLLDYEREYYLGIISKLQKNEPISLEEYGKLDKLVEQKAFISLANRFFNLFVVFQGTKEEYDNFKITVETMKNYLIKYIFINVVKNSTSKVLEDKGTIFQSGAACYEEKGRFYFKSTNGVVSEYGELRKVGKNFFAVLQGDKWLLLDLNGSIITIEIDGVGISKFDKINNHFNDYGMFTVLINGRKILLNSNIEQILPKGRTFDDVDLNYLKYGLILVNEEGKGNVVFDINGTQISPEGECLDKINLSFYLKGIIIVVNKDGDFVLNLNWKPLAKIPYIPGYNEKPAGKGFDLTLLKEYKGGIFYAQNIDGNGLGLFDLNGSLLSEGEKYEYFDIRFLEKYGVVIAFDGKNMNLLKKGVDGLFYAFEKDITIPLEDNKGLYIERFRPFRIKKYIVKN